MKLTQYEMQMAATVGINRRIESLVRGIYRNPYGADSGLGLWDADIEAAGAEIVVAKSLAVYWGGGINTFKAADVGYRYQVRHTVRTANRLIIRPVDPDQDIYILVIGRMPDFEIKGWIRGTDAKRPDWLFNPGDQRPAAYFVPQEALSHISELYGVRV